MIESPRSSTRRSLALLVVLTGLLPLLAACAARRTPSVSTTRSPSTQSRSTPPASTATVSTPSTGAPPASSPPATSPAASSSSTGAPASVPSEPAAAAPPGPAGSPETTPRRASGPAGGAAGSGARTSEERASDLDRELRGSLAEFDALLLREQERLDAQRAASGGSLDRGDSGTAGGSEPGEAGAEELEASAPASSEPRRPTSSNGVVPPDIPDSRDDDIVARQLREAAMSEPDPELRRRLWDEYRAYKGLPRSAQPEPPAAGAEPGATSEGGE